MRAAVIPTERPRGTCPYAVHRSDRGIRHTTRVTHRSRGGHPVPKRVNPYGVDPGREIQGRVNPRLERRKAPARAAVASRPGLHPHAHHTCRSAICHPDGAATSKSRQHQALQRLRYPPHTSRDALSTRLRPSPGAGESRGPHPSPGSVGRMNSLQQTHEVRLRGLACPRVWKFVGRARGVWRIPRSLRSLVYGRVRRDRSVGMTGARRQMGRCVQVKPRTGRAAACVGAFRFSSRGFTRPWNP
jgi:hypothetical protein